MDTQIKNSVTIDTNTNLVVTEPEIEKTYIFIRHGEIYYGSWFIWRTTRFFCSDVDDPPLSEKGFSNSKLLSRIFKEKKIQIDNMFVSPFSRCIQSAIQLKDEYPEKISMEINTLISEYQTFPWTYKCSTYPQGVPNTFTSPNKKTINLVFPEPYDQLKNRCLFFFNNILCDYNNCVILTHGSIMNFFANHFKPKNYLEQQYNINFSGYIIYKKYKNGTFNVEICENPDFTKYV